jgi:hypothetical protein
MNRVEKTRFVHCACPAIQLPCTFAHLLASLEVPAQPGSLQLRALGTSERRIRTGTARDDIPDAIDPSVKTMRRRVERISCELRYHYAFNRKTRSASQRSTTREYETNHVASHSSSVPGVSWYARNSKIPPFSRGGEVGRKANSCASCMARD